MNDFKVRKVPAFGEWNYVNGIPVSQYSVPTKHVGLLHHSFMDGDLYGESYINGEDIRIPVISKKRIEGHDLQHGQKYETPRAITAYKVPKPIDEDLYQIPRKRKKNSSFFSRCYEPACDE